MQPVHQIFGRRRPVLLGYLVTRGGRRSRCHRPGCWRSSAEQSRAVPWHANAPKQTPGSTGPEQARAGTKPKRATTRDKKGRPACRMMGGRNEFGMRETPATIQRGWNQTGFLHVPAAANTKRGDIRYKGAGKEGTMQPLLKIQWT